MKNVLLIFFLLSIFVVFISSEVIVMKDDRAINGKIIKMDEDTMTIITKTEEIVIEKEDVAKIYYSEKEYEKEKNENIKKEVSEQGKKQVANRREGELWQKALNLVNENKTKEAIAVFDKEIELVANNGYFYMARGSFYLWPLENNEKARIDFFKALELIEGDKSTIANLYWLIGRSYYLVRENPNYEKAIESFNKSIEINPQLAHSYRERGDVYLHIGQYDKALKDIKKAIELDTNEGFAHILLGRYYSLKNRIDDAIKEYSLGIELDKKRGGKDLDWPNYHLGELYLIKNRREDAINAFKVSARAGFNNAKIKLKELGVLDVESQLKNEKTPDSTNPEIVNKFAQPILDMISKTDSHYKDDFLKNEYLWPKIFGGKTIIDGETNIDTWVSLKGKNIKLKNPKINYKNFVMQLEVDLKNINNEIFVDLNALKDDRSQYHLRFEIQKNGRIGIATREDGKNYKEIISTRIDESYYKQDSSQITIILLNNSYAFYINAYPLFGFYYKPEWDSNIIEFFITYHKDYDIKKRKIEVPFKNFKIWDLDRIIK